MTGTASATFTFNSSSAPHVQPTNWDFEVDNSGWSLVTGSIVVRDATKGYTGTASAKYVTPTIVRASISTNFITVTPNTNYILSGYIWNSLTGTGSTARFDVDVTGQGGNPTVCSAASTLGNNAWEYVSCTFNTGAGTTGIKVRIITEPNAANTGSAWYDSIGVAPVTINLPTGSTGRRVSLYSTSGAEIYAIAGDTTATIPLSASGTYFWRITNVDGLLFLDNSAWATVNAGDTWTWTNAALAKDATWNIVSAGDATNGYYAKVQRNGADYLYTGSALGANLAAGKTVTASSSYNAGCSGLDGQACSATDGNLGTRWLTLNVVPQWVCVDFGVATAFNRIHYIQRRLEGYGGNAMSIQVAPADTGCSDAGMADITGTAISRPQYQELTTWSFTSQTKRYVRIYFTSVYGRAEAYEFQAYNDAGANNRLDVEQLVMDDGGASVDLAGGFNYSTASTDVNGNITFTKTLTGTTANLSVTTTYTKMSPDVWRKRMVLTPTLTRNVYFRNILHNENATCLGINAEAYGACGTGNNNTLGFQDAAFGTPYAFGIVADNGCNALWTILSASSATYPDNTDVSGAYVGSFYNQSFIGYGKKYDNTPALVLTANTPYTFDTFIYRSLDPAPFAVQKKGPIALADGAGKTGLWELDKNIWGTSYQLVRIPLATQPNYCYFVAGQHYTASANGLYEADSIWGAIGLNNAKVTQKMVSAWQKAAQVGSVTTEVAPFNDTLNLATPSFVQGGQKNSAWMATLLGFAVKKGYVTIQTTCSNTETCVTTAARDELYNALDGTISTNGEVTGALCCDGLVANLMDANNVTDMGAYVHGHSMAAYKAMQDSGAVINAAKYTNMKNAYANLYNATDGYVYYSKYGHWRNITDAGANGGTYNEASGDYFGTTPATARFVVPAGYTNAAATYFYRKAANYGQVAVNKNGVAVTGSPFDLYAATAAFASSSIGTVSTGDVLTFAVTNAKNASSTAYKVTLDAIQISTTTYQENDVNFVCGSLGGDCLNGYTRGWMRWKEPGLALYGEFILRSVYGVSVLTDAQVRSHLSNMPSANMGNGTFNDYFMDYNEQCVAAAYWQSWLCGQYQNGASWFLFDTLALRLASLYMTDSPISYRWDEKSSKWAYIGTWTNETNSANYYGQYVYLSSDVTATAVFSGVPFNAAYVYMITGAGQGTVKIFFDSGAGWDAGTTVDLSVASNPVYSKTGLAYANNYRIKVQPVTGTVRLDYIKTNTTPSYLLTQRINQEYAIQPYDKESMEQDFLSANYQKLTPGRGSTYYGWNILYGGLLHYPKMRLGFKGYFLRRPGQ